MLPSICNETVTRLRATTTEDPYNDQADDWDSAASLSIPGCSVQPVAGSEVLDGRNAVVSRWVLFAPLDADLAATDRVRHKGSDYEVDGSVQDWPDVFGLGHKSCYLRRVEG